MVTEEPAVQPLRVLTQDVWNELDEQWDQHLWLSCGICGEEWRVPSLAPERAGTIFNYVLGHVRWHNVDERETKRLPRPAPHPYTPEPPKVLHPGVVT